MRGMPSIGRLKLCGACPDVFQQPRRPRAQSQGLDELGASASGTTGIQAEELILEARGKAVLEAQRISD
jgi:hypothetical protein